MPWSDEEKFAIKSDVASTKSDVDAIKASVAGIEKALVGTMKPGDPPGLVPMVTAIVAENKTLKESSNKAMKFVIIAIMISLFALGQSALELITEFVKLLRT